jgi:hypothetical protein
LKDKNQSGPDLGGKIDPVLKAKILEAKKHPANVGLFDDSVTVPKSLDNASVRRISKNNKLPYELLDKNHYLYEIDPNKRAYKVKDLKLPKGVKGFSDDSLIGYTKQFGLKISKVTSGDLLKFGGKRGAGIGAVAGSALGAGIGMYRAHKNGDSVLKGGLKGGAIGAAGGAVAGAGLGAAGVYQANKKYIGNVMIHK